MKEWNVATTKIDKETYTKLLNYCKMEKITPSFFLRSLIEKGLLKIIPTNKAGINNIEYRKKEDSFSWNIEFDDGEKIEISENIPSSFFVNLKESIDSALSLRNLYTGKKKKQSVSVPTSLNKLRWKNVR